MTSQHPKAPEAQARLEEIAHAVGMTLFGDKEEVFDEDRAAHVLTQASINLLKGDPLDVACEKAGATAAEFHLLIGTSYNCILYTS
ncbi:MAG: hypothetical protein MPK62_11875, partial [Alphaproteobacteria bacterium]|nr:hypothetical protein [Alphaproteobacteria bacterium]